MSEFAESEIMASKVNAPGDDITEDTSVDPNSNAEVWNMKVNDVVGQLSDESFKKRVVILKQLIVAVKRNDGRLPYSDHEAIFRGLGLSLSDDHWEIRLKCIGLIQELIPNLQGNLDHCMSLVLYKLISNIGDSKVTVRKAVISSLHRYMKHTHDLPSLLQAIINTGLENESAGVRREMISALPMLLTKDFIDANLNGVIQSLAKKLLDTSMENNLKDVALSTLQSIEKLLGEEQFDIYIQQLSPSMQTYLHQLTGKTEQCFSKETEEQRGTQETVTSQDILEFGCIPCHVITCVSDKQDFKIRTQAVEDLKGVILSLTPMVFSQKLVPHIIPFVSFLSALLDDTNFKIITVALEIMYSLVEKLSGNVKNYAQNLVTALTKCLDDNKIVIRQSITQIVMKMMQCSSPQLVICVLFDNLTHRNSRVRQETVNLIITALLTFPSYEFEFPVVCLAVGPSLTDVKRQVRQAALECFAVLAQAMGPGHMQPLVQAVDQVEITSDGEGLMAAVQARLARRQLPKLNAVGLVEYATPLPSSASQRSNSAGTAADTKWILAAAAGSAKSVRSDMMELESVVSFSTRTGLATTDTSVPVPAPGRVMSAGRGRHKLSQQEGQSRAYKDLPNSAPAELQQRETPRSSRRPPSLIWDAVSRTPPIARKGPLQHRATVANLGQQQEESAGSIIKNYQHRRPVANGLWTQAFTGTGNVPVYRDNKDNGYTRPEQRTSRTLLDPISGRPANIASDGSIQGSGDVSSDQEPLSQRLSPYRGSTKVPPIASSAGAGVSVKDNDEAESTSAASTTTSPSRTGPQGGLQSTGNRKKAQHQFDSLERQTQAQIFQDDPHAQHRNEPQEKLKTETTSSSRGDKAATQQTCTVSHRHTAGDSLDINDNSSKDSAAHHTSSLPARCDPFPANSNADVQVVIDDDDGFSAYRTRSEQQVGVHAHDRHSRGASGSREYKEKDSQPVLTKSPSFRNSIAAKQRMKKELEESRQEPEQDSEFQQERDRQQQKLKKLGSNDSLSDGGVTITLSSSPSPSNMYSGSKTTGHQVRPPGPAVTPRKSTKTKSNEAGTTQPRPLMDRSPEAEPPAPEDWKPFSDPEAALRAAQNKLENEDWELKTDGLDMIRRLVHFHPHTISAASVLHPVILAVVKEVKNLRSQVSRLAIVCLGDMFVGLTKAMDPDVEIVTRQLLAKAGESNNFIRDDVEHSLSSMVERVTAKQALLALILGGATHKNMVVRRTTAQFVVLVVERMGPGKILSGVKDITDRVLPTAAHFAMDGSPETRYYGRKILFLLMPHQDFDRMLTKYLPVNTLRNIQDVVENLKNKGMGDKPSETASGRSRLSGLGSRSGSSVRGGSAASSVDGQGSTPPTHRKTTRTDEATVNEIKVMITQLSSSDWRVRYDAVTSFHDMCFDRPDAVSLHIVKILDVFVGRLQDANSKVLVHALKVMKVVVPTLKEALHAVTSMAVTAVVPNLASKNPQVSSTADAILDSFLQHLDQAVLIQPFSNQAQCATGQSKAQMVLKVAYLTDRVYERKPKQIVLHVLPLLWHLLAVIGSGVWGELRPATATLAATLHSHMGQALLDRAGSEPSVTARHIEFLNEVL